MKLGLFFLPLLLLVAGCSTHKQLYYYGDYSQEYYSSKKELSAESRIALQHSIEEAIQNANNSTTGRVAPGLYANLGYLYLKANNTQKAIEYFEKEKALYSESAKFMDRMIQKVKALQGEQKDEN